MINAIHQFSPAAHQGDGVTSAMVYTRQILFDLGYPSNIYSEHIDQPLVAEISHIKNYSSCADNILLYHFSIGYDRHDKVMQFADKKILVYHNITPAHFFPNTPHLQDASNLGRQQLEQSLSFFSGSYTDSAYNAAELHYYGYEDTRVIPVLVDLNKKKNIRPTQVLMEQHSNTFNLLYIGRIVTNKCQDQLLDTLFLLNQQGIDDIRLFIVGGISEPDYFEYISRKTDVLGLKDKVIITNKVTREDLAAYYEIADVYLSLSEHEGFGMPLLEAIQYGIPVLSYHAGGVATAMGVKGLLEFKAADRVAEKIIEIRNNPSFRAEVTDSQKSHLTQFSYQNQKDKLSDFLSKLA